jgi:Glycosyltransferases involved in cell wall biogenesis
VSTAEPGISVCIVCRNEADRLGPCLESVRWADEVVVVDLMSTDGSAEIARLHGATVIEREPVPIVELVRNEASAAARNDWILALDPDERVTPGLAEELMRLRHRDLDAVTIPVMNQDFGYPAESPLHRYDPKPRFYRRDRVRWPETPNDLPEIDPKRLHHLQHRDDVVLVHLRNRSIAEALERAMRYAPAEAQALIDRGETFTAAKMLRRVATKSHKQFIQAHALEEGMPGLLRAATLVSFHFWVWAAFWQQSGARRTEEDDRLLRRIDRLLRLVTTLAAVARLPRRVISKVHPTGRKPGASDGA